ncbi:E3 ubiquitin-protein ligase RING1, partial [Cucurbita argyrosperma subsp. sororia]
MDIDSQRILEEFPQSTAHIIMDNNQQVNELGPVQPLTCVFCRSVLEPDNDATAESEAIGICGDCKFLLFEDIETPLRDSSHRTTPRGRRTRHGSSESAENLFSQEFTQMINLVRQRQSSISGHGDRYTDGSNAADFMQHSSSHTTPNQSRRWRQVYSDSENDGLDSLDSMFGESESNFSFGPYRHSYGDSDVVSYRTYGGDSDASLDGHSFLDTDNFILPDEGSGVDTDTDIDPMRAGVVHWDSSDEEDDRGELTEADTEHDALQDFHVSSASGRGNYGNWNEELSLSEYEGSARDSITNNARSELGDSGDYLDRQGSSPGQIRRNMRFYSITNYAQSESVSYVGDSGDYLDRQSFEELLEQIAETTSSRRGAPPAAISFVKNLSRLVISKEHLKHDGISCAICKDFFLVGVEVNQLPCLHLYHPPCILPWLTARNSCPLCRYELPTDDRDYEEGKQSSTNAAEIQRLQHQVTRLESRSDLNGVGANPELDTSQGVELSNIDPAVSNSYNSGRGRRSWLFVAAPVVGLVGIALMFWVGNPSGGRITDRRQLDTRGADSSNQRENRTRRWW